MQPSTFRGLDLRSVIVRVHRSLGDDAMILGTKVLKRSAGDVYEVVAARPEAVEHFRRSLADGPVGPRIAKRTGRRPFVMALVGPPGAGKTTAAMKVALHPRGLNGRKVGIVTLDTYRVAAVEEIQTYAEIAGLPLEVVYHPREVPEALARLESVDAVVVDTPGRSTSDSGWVQALRELKADEVHLVLPASIRLEVARELRQRLAAVGPTHAMYTKLDELPGERGFSALAETMELPVRWVGDGYEIPGSLAPAASRLGAAPVGAAHGSTAPTSAARAARSTLSTYA